jgi:hypothetical protein
MVPGGFRVSPGRCRQAGFAIYSYSRRAVDGRGLAPLSTSPTRVGPLAACGGARLPSALAARSARAPRLHDHARGVLEAEREGEGAARPHGDPPADLELTLRRGPCSSGRFSHGGEGRRSRRLGQVALLGDAAERGRARPLPAAPASAVRYPVPPRHERLLRRARVRRVERPTADDVRRPRRKRELISPVVAVPGVELPEPARLEMTDARCFALPPRRIAVSVRLSVVRRCEDDESEQRR